MSPSINGVQARLTSFLGSGDAGEWTLRPTL